MDYIAERSVVKTYLKDLLVHEKVIEMKDYIQHGSITTYHHCFDVAVMSYIIAKKLGVQNVCMKELLVGAMLHDFYLYDWHNVKKRPEGLHGFSHPTIALNNANKFFSLNNREQNIIKSHMFPLTIRSIPKTREAVIVCIADKICATKETVSGIVEKLSFKQSLNKA